MSWIEPRVCPGPLATSPTAVSLGPTLIGRQRLRPLRYANGQDGTAAADTISVNFVLEGLIMLHTSAGQRRCCAGDVLILNNVQNWSFTAETPVSQIALVAPRGFLAPVLPGCPATGVVEASPAWRAVLDFAQAVLALGANALSSAAADMAAFALRDLLVAASTPTATPVTAIRNRRDATLLERLADFVDAHLDAELTVPDLCLTLGCSRSTLYRAATPAGGIAELIARRRLAAIHRLLRDPAETGPITAIAERHGFAEPGQFNRRFKQVFGMTAGRVRAQARSSMQGEYVFGHFDALAAGERSTCPPVLFP